MNKMVMIYDNGKFAESRMLMNTIGALDAWVWHMRKK